MQSQGRTDGGQGRGEADSLGGRGLGGGRNLSHLLLGKGQAGLQLLGEGSLQLGVVGKVLQGHGGLHADVLDALHTTCYTSGPLQWCACWTDNPILCVAAIRLCRTARLRLDHGTLGVITTLIDMNYLKDMCRHVSLADPAASAGMLISSKFMLHA